MPPWKISFKALIHLQPEGRSHAYYGPRPRRHYSRSQSCPHSHCDRSCNFRWHNSTLLPAFAAACSTLHPMDTPAMRATGIVTPILCLPFLLQVPLTPLHGPEPLLLQQLPPCRKRFSAQEDKAMSKTLNPHKPHSPNCHHPGFSFRLFIRF